ncbi:MAG: cytidylyltransferase domain-containing protein [Phycisphaerae bacterium]
MQIHRLAVILARAGSKGLPGKNILPLAGRPMITYTLAQAKAASTIDAVCVSTDLPEAADEARALNIIVIDRPEELATDTAPVDAAVRHAVEAYERMNTSVTHVAILYGNVPVRSPGIIDRAIMHLLETGADSVRSISSIEKQHPDWIHRLEGDRLVQYRENSIHRRQDLEPLYYHDGAVVAVTRSSLFKAHGDDPHAFFGRDRRGIVSRGGPTVDVDSAEDLLIAEAILRGRSERNLHSPIDSSRTVLP